MPEADEGPSFTPLALTPLAEGVARKCLDPLVERVRESSYRSSNAYVIYDISTLPARCWTRRTIRAGLALAPLGSQCACEDLRGHFWLLAVFVCSRKRQHRGRDAQRLG